MSLGVAPPKFNGLSSKTNTYAHRDLSTFMVAILTLAVYTHAPSVFPRELPKPSRRLRNEPERETRTKEKQDSLLAKSML